MSLLSKWAEPRVRFLQGDVRAVLPTLPDSHFDCAVTSPPYFGLRDYGCEGQIGLEVTLDAYLAEMVAVCLEVRRVLKPTGTFWLNIGDSYAATRSYQVSQSKHQAHDYGKSNASKVPNGLKPKDLMMVPARLALALQADGWWLRSEIIWAKPNPMPESVTDRPTSAHEKIWLLTKSERYYFDAEAIKEAASGLSGGKSGVGTKADITQTGGKLTRALGRACNLRNTRNVWMIAPKPFKEAHFATFPPELAERCIKAGSPAGGHVLDPFGGAGTTGLVAKRLGRDATLVELNPAYIEMARRRVASNT